MGGIGQMVRWARSLLAALVAVALITAPAAAVQAAPCHDHVARQHDQADQRQDRSDHRYASAPERDSSPAMRDQDRSVPERAAIDLKSCCATICAVCLLVIGEEEPATVQRPAAPARFEWSDQARAGVVLAPTPGPPRLPA
jgi:hypothetical protein